MTVPRKNRLALLAGFALLGFVTIPTLSIVNADVRQPVFGPNFAPANAWLWIGLQLLLVVGLGLSTLGLLRRIPWGYCVWSQAVLSFLVLTAYIGWLRREDDYRRWPDPDDYAQAAPEATWIGFVWLVLLWLALGALPLALRIFNRFMKARKSSRQAGRASTHSPSASDKPRE